MNFFKKKTKKEILPMGTSPNSEWWKKCKELFKKDTGGAIDPDDPEYDSQKIYQHWLKSFMAKK